MSFSADDIVAFEFGLAIALFKHEHDESSDAKRRKWLDTGILRLERGLEAYQKALGHTYSMELRISGLKEMDSGGLPSWLPKELMDQMEEMTVEDVISETDDFIALCRI